MKHNIFKFSLFNTLLFGLLLSLNTSCVITHTPGFYSGYKRLSHEQKSKVIKVDDTAPLPQMKDFITYAITAKHLEQILRTSPKSIVYFWQPHCSGSACISIPAFQKYCLANGYKPIVVAQYFDYEMLEVQGVSPSTVFAINHWYYKTDYCVKYFRKFREKLFESFKIIYKRENFSNYLYYKDEVLSMFKPSDLDKYPGQS
jgi:hypothetical protein